MVRLFRHHVPSPVLLLCGLDALLLLAAADMGWVLRARQIGMAPGSFAERLPQFLTFALALQLALVGVGAYTAASLLSLRFAAARLAVAISLGVILLSVVFLAIPALGLWRSNLLYAMGIASVLLVGVRAALGRVLGGDRFKQRVVVLGAGPRAARLLALAGQPGINHQVVGTVAMDDAERAVAGAVPRAAIADLAAHVVALDAADVVVALEEHRGALPLADLLRLRTLGLQVHDLPAFLERETGRIDLATLDPAGLLFSDGFASRRMASAATRRVFDIAASLALLVLTLPVVLATALAIRLDSRGPAFYRQRRVGLYERPFDIVKLRSMRVDAEAGGTAIWAGEDDPRVTRIGRLIRRVRIDELPQCWTVLKGDMSFVGPRPERPQFVEALAGELPFYAERHSVKPGITGWAQINLPYAASVDDARRKLEYDLYYAKNHSPLLDLLILLQTLRVVLWPSGAR